MRVRAELRCAAPAEQALAQLVEVAHHLGVGRLQLVVRRARASVSHRRRLRRRPRRRRRHVARAQLRRNLVAQRRELCLEGAHLGVGLGHCGGFCGAFAPTLTADAKLLAATRSSTPCRREVWRCTAARRPAQPAIAQPAANFTHARPPRAQQAQGGAPRAQFFRTARPLGVVVLDAGDRAAGAQRPRLAVRRHGARANELPDVLAPAVLAAGGCEPVVRLPSVDGVLTKRLLDAGAARSRTRASRAATRAEGRPPRGTRVARAA